MKGTEEAKENPIVATQVINYLKEAYYQSIGENMRAYQQEKAELVAQI